MRRYGDVFCMRFGPRRAYLLSHPEDVRHVLEDDQNIYAKAPTAERVRLLFGDSLTTVDGERWQRSDASCGRRFGQGRWFGLLPIVIEATAQMLDRWASLAERGETVDVSREMTDSAKAIIVKLVFGDVREAQARAVGEALESALQHVNRRVRSPLGCARHPHAGPASPRGRAADHRHLRLRGRSPRPRRRSACRIAARRAARRTRRPARRAVARRRSVP